MTYFNTIDTLEPRVEGCLRELTVFYNFTEEDKKRINVALLKATQLGFSVNYRAIAIKDLKRNIIPMTAKEVLEKMQEANEVTEEQWIFLNSLPHWNPILDLERTLNMFIEQITNLGKDNQEESEEVLAKILDKISSEKNFYYDSKMEAK